MKFKSLLMLGFVVFLAVACGGKGAAIVNNWTLDDITIPDAAMEGLSDEQKEAAKSNLKNIVSEMKGKMNFDFKADGKVTTEAPDMFGGDEPKKSEGTWKLSEDQKTLTIEVDGKPEDFKVVELSGSKLQIEQERMGMVFIPKK